jgi:cell division septum initiation protein DivIVA
MSRTREAVTVGPTRLMRLAARSADQLLVEARAEAESMKVAARAESDQILADARNEAVRLLVDVEEARARIREDVALMRRVRLARRDQIGEHPSAWRAEEEVSEVG